MNEITELYRRYRPTIFKHVHGQEAVCRTLYSMTKTRTVPHALLFCGPSGCGKTTLARIVATKLECGAADMTEINCADFRGIDMVRDIRSRMMLSPISGKVRVWIIDEAHALSKDAQNALLKMLEDTPSHVHFMLATTEPEKLLNTIRTRCTELKVKLLTPAQCTTMLVDVLEREKKTVEKEVIEKVVEHGEGSARKALVLLDAALKHEKTEDQIAAVESSDHKAQAIQLARMLLNPRAQWTEVAALLKTIEDEPESIRYLVLAYMSNVMLGAGKMTARAFQVADVFQNNFYDSKRAGLVLACYAVTKG